jgi:hypothetical protein
VEVGEQSPLRVHRVLLHLTLETHPLESGMEENIAFLPF